MFAERYFAQRYFPLRYFPKVGFDPSGILGINLQNIFYPIETLSVGGVAEDTPLVPEATCTLILS